VVPFVGAHTLRQLWAAVAAAPENGWDVVPAPLTWISTWVARSDGVVGQFVVNVVGTLWSFVGPVGIQGAELRQGVVEIVVELRWGGRRSGPGADRGEGGGRYTGKGAPRYQPRRREAR
jgi:hypothetical protein